MDTAKKILTLRSLKQKLKILRTQGCEAAFTNGCFDILHFGHVSYLQAAKRSHRILIVGLNSDASVRRIKGPRRPITPERHRAAVLAALACVDYVTIFEEETPLALIQALRPDVLIKGADWKGRAVAGGDVVKAYGGRVEFIEYIPKCSSTKIIETILERCRP